MSQLMEDDECNVCMEYVAFIADHNKWTCEVCHLTEDVMEYDSKSTYNIIWGRYELRCGHQAHIRCYRKWCKILGKYHARLVIILLNKQEKINFVTSVWYLDTRPRSVKCNIYNKNTVIDYF